MRTRRKALSATEPAKVICGQECKPFNFPALRVVPNVAVRHPEATLKIQNSQQAIIGVAKISQPWKRHKRCAKPNKPTKTGYKEVPVIVD
ncbi:hypothetical protein WJX77_012113 [Trebouxia sp. C0004]